MKNENCKNTLFINYGGIGDEILFLPVISGFKKLYPKSKITLCLEPRAKGIKNLTDLIDDVIEVDIKAKGFKKYFNILNLIFKTWSNNFDTIISSGKSPLVALILFLSKAKTKIGYKTKTSFLLSHSVKLNQNQYAGYMYFDLISPFEKVDFEIPEIKHDENFELPYGVCNKEYILIHPGVSLMSIQKGIYKCPESNFWISLIKELLINNKVLLAGGPDDKKIIDEITRNKEISDNPNFYSMFNKTKNLYQMAGLIKKSKRMICCDSAPFHLGVSLNTDITVIFGPTNENKLVFKRDNIKVVKKDLACRPCLWDERTENCQASFCLNVSKEDVLNTVE